VATPVAAPAVWIGLGVRIADVAQHLGQLRAEAGDDLSSTRTSVMNLVAWVPNQADARDVEAVADSLRAHHPSRAIIIVPAGGTDRIDARVDIMSSVAPGSSCTLLFEQIVLTLHGAVAAHAGSAVIPLLRSELPTYLWWPTAPDPSSPTFLELVRVADRVVTETGRSLRGRAALGRLAAVTASSPAPVTDLAWAILTAWRQVLATSLRDEALTAVRAGPASVTITCPAGEPSLEALLLGGWLVDVLGDDVQVTFAQGVGSEDILGVKIDAHGACVVELVRDDADNHVTLRTAGGGPRSLPLPPPNRRELLAGELELRGHDRPLEHALAKAVRF
jgi:glucose-6-phosphate dehydrogenase assembly protein OpcA